VSILENFMSSVNWYDPTTDSADWANFQETISFASGPVTTIAPLLGSANFMADQFFPNEDTGMWYGLKQNFEGFLQKYPNVDPSTPLSDAMQYDYVRCFLNGYAQAAHNSDLWQSMYDCARTVLVFAGLWP
jgi:hypothetical protein